MRIHGIHARNRHAQRGSALFMSVLVILVLSGMSGAILAVGIASQRQVHMSIARARALAAAEAAIGDAFLQVTAGLTADIGSHKSPRSFSDDAYYGTAVVNADKSVTVVGVGRSGAARRALEVVIDPGGGGVFQNAIFSGNASNDPTYVMKFSGKGKQADKVVGDIYSGGTISFNDNATLKGTPRAFGSVTTVAGSLLPVVGSIAIKPESGVKQPIPDIPGMHYETSNDVDVAKEFKASTLKSDDAGGKAWQLPQTNPAHIFRMDPDDRKANWSTTTKHDYFLEDPYTPVRSDSKSDGTDPFLVALSSAKTLKGSTEGNRKVYFIDGNLWVHNLSAMSMMISSPDSTGVQVTFVVKGNIYLSDNVFVKDTKKDGVAFIAMKDSAVKDSGNVYFGDPTFGTLEHMNAYFYAENNFYDNNLNATGSAIVDLIGNMTAGEKVAINRDSGTQHSRLSVTFDDRIATGALDMPGLPKAAGVTSAPSVRVWREVGVPNE